MLASRHVCGQAGTRLRRGGTGTAGAEPKWIATLGNGDCLLLVSFPGDRAVRVVGTTSTGTSFPQSHLVVGLRDEETRKSEGRRSLMENGSQNRTKEPPSSAWNLLLPGESIHKSDKLSTRD
jgi:hypothetical protein